MTPNDASSEARKNLRLIAGELRVSLRGISDDDLNIVAIRFVMSDDVQDGRITVGGLQRIVDDVRNGSGQATGETAMASRSSAADTSQEPALPSAPNVGGGAVADAAPRKHGYRFNSTEADRRQRHKLAMQHLSETSRTGLFIVPRRPKRLPVDVPHPACLVAARERVGTVCQRCSWLLNDEPYTEAWLDRDDSTGGRL